MVFARALQYRHSQGKKAGCSAKWERSQNGKVPQVLTKSWAPVLFQAYTLVNTRFIYYTEESGAWSLQKSFCLPPQWQQWMEVIPWHKAYVLSSSVYLYHAIHQNTPDLSTSILLILGHLFQTNLHYSIIGFFANNQCLLLTQNIHWRNRQQNNFYSLSSWKFLIKRCLVKD